MLATVLLALCTAGAADTNRWVHSYRSALKAAAAEEKPILLSFHAEWCGWCKVMDQEVFENPDLQGRLDDLVCAKIDIEHEPQTALAFGVSSVPRTILLNKYSQVVSDTLGYLEPEMFVQMLDAAAPDLNRELPETMAAPESDAAKVGKVVEAIQFNEQSAALPEPVLAYLSHADPDVRAETRDALARHEKSVLPGLVQALGSDYLGTRISAHALLRKLSDHALPYDPWAPAAERAAAQRAWRDSLSGDR